MRNSIALLGSSLLLALGCAALTVRLAAGMLHRLEAQASELSRVSWHLLENQETVARHSGASRVRIRLRQAGDDVRVTIADNGRGLPADHSAVRHGLGLIGMRARARSAGGEVRFSNQPGGGLCIEVRVPARGVRHDEEKDPGLARR